MEELLALLQNYGSQVGNGFQQLGNNAAHGFGLFGPNPGQAQTGATPGAQSPAAGMGGNWQQAAAQAGSAPPSQAAQQAAPQPGAQSAPQRPMAQPLPAPSSQLPDLMAQLGSPYAGMGGGARGGVQSPQFGLFGFQAPGMPRTPYLARP